jgi:hypothetical protein
MAAELVSALVRRSVAQAIQNGAGKEASASPPHHHNVGALHMTDLSDEEVDEGDEPLRSAAPSAHGPFLRNAARSGPCVAAWHDAIPNESHRAALQQDAEQLVGQTFWMSAEDSPTCALERMALGVLHFHSARAPSSEPRPSGCEWWVQVRRSSGTPTIRLHWDSDEEHKATAGEHVCRDGRTSWKGPPATEAALLASRSPQVPPWLATVTYLGSYGAPTVVLPVAADAHGRAVRAGADAFISHPVAGKHLAFDGRLLHGALHELGVRDARPHTHSATHHAVTPPNTPSSWRHAHCTATSVCASRDRRVRHAQP